MLQREPADFSQPLPKLLEAWCADLIGALDGPLQDISGGGWRRLRYSGGEEWPAAVPAWERRKFLGRVGGRPVLLKYAGLGEVGDQKLALARTLHSEGLTPQPLGLVHGFIAELWLEDAAGLPPEDEPVSEIARYLSTRARLLPAPSDSGASIEELLAMARRNLTLELGGDSVAALDHWRARLPELERRVVRVRTDNKLDRQEWLRARGGPLIKTDALDHHQAHDLVGCQPLEWDVAGAIAEFDLDQKGAAFLVRQLGDQGARIDSELLRFCHVAYLAFRIGRARLAEGVSDREDGVRLSRRAADYARRLRCLLQLSRAATRPESLVD